MAPSRSGGDLTLSPAGTGAGSRLALYAGLDEGELAETFDFVNLLAEWPGEAGPDAKWDGMPPVDGWDPVGQRVSLLLADLHERPRRAVVTLGGWTHQVMMTWGGLLQSHWLDGRPGPGGCVVYKSPHPSGTSTWWNDHRAAGERFWRDTAAFAQEQLPKAPVKVKMRVRAAWFSALADRFSMDGWPGGCVDWPWVDPPGRPSTYLRGNAVPAAHAALDLSGQPRPSIRHQALHSCDRGESCVNLRHLRWGTELENRLDQSARARGDIGKVGLEQALAVRAELEEISSRTGVPMDAIQRIAGGRSWSEDSWTEDQGETTHDAR